MLPVRVEGFDWEGGNREKCQQHGVSIAEIEGIFRNAPRVAPDLKHSAAEDRVIAVGRTNTGRAVFVAFTIRTKKGRRLIRLMSSILSTGSCWVAFYRSKTPMCGTREGMNVLRQFRMTLEADTANLVLRRLPSRS